MYRTRGYALLVMAVLAFGCASGVRPIDSEPRSARSEDSKRYPNDWFVRQRMSSGEVIPVRARARALADLRARQARRAVDASAPGTWTQVGPENIGGRVTAMAVDPNDPARIWVGAAAGGVWRTTDGGVTWTPVFDDQTAQSIGAVTAHPTDSAVVYVGTGEDNGGGYSYDGEGVFKTTDGGATWTSLGLAETRRIGRIAIDPLDPDRVFVAAGGGVFNEDEHRGIYRSTDGGATWVKVLFVSNRAGGADVVIDPSDPDRVYAAIWERQSTHTGVSWGGPDCGIWQSVDGGDTWAQLGAGLPTTNLGRIGLALAASSPNIVYARYQNSSGSFKGIWATTDSGATWTKVDGPGFWRNFLVSYGYYFGQIRVDPQNPNHVFLLDVRWFESTNGGVSFQVKTGGIHVDHHDMIIEPGRLLMGNDGGFYSSTDGGTSWTHATTLPISQAYDIAIDTLQPLRRFMGLQDNGTVRTTTGGLSDWTEVLGGDGLQCEVDPTDSNRVYASSQGGNINRSTNGGDSFSNGTSGIGNERTNWNAPVTHDPVTSQRLYTGTTKVYRTIDGAQSWTAISPDLTNGTPAALGPTDPDEFNNMKSHLADVVRGTVTAIGVSSVDTQIVWAGTDDGNVWVTDDGGAIWNQVDVPGRTEWVTRVTADPFDAQSAYVTFSGFREDDRLPHVFRTTDLGATWIDIAGDLPDVPLNDVVPDPDWKGRLFVASDLGTFLTDDWGASWSEMNGGMPVVVVHDLQLHQPDRTLYAGTHARSLWTYDLGQLPPPDRDGDGTINVDDCAPDDGGAFAAPGEVQGVVLDPDLVTIRWQSAQPSSGTATVHDVLRGELVELPVGSGASEICLDAGVAGDSTTDASTPSPGSGRWYLVRARNACATATYGFESDADERLSTACP